MLHHYLELWRWLSSICMLYQASCFRCVCTCCTMHMAQVKLVVSGSWESALLKVTWPDDLPPDETLVRDDKQKCVCGWIEGGSGILCNGRGLSQRNKRRGSAREGIEIEGEVLVHPLRENSKEPVFCQNPCVRFLAMKIRATRSKVNVAPFLVQGPCRLKPPLSLGLSEIRALFLDVCLKPEGPCAGAPRILLLCAVQPIETLRAFEPLRVDQDQCWRLNLYPIDVVCALIHPTIPCCVCQFYHVAPCRCYPWWTLSKPSRRIGTSPRTARSTGVFYAHVVCAWQIVPLVGYHGSSES